MSRLAMSQRIIKIDGVSVAAQYKMKKTASVGISISTPNGAATQSGRDATRPILIAETISFCLAGLVALSDRIIIPATSLIKMRIIGGLIDARRASSKTHLSFQNQPPTCES